MVTIVLELSADLEREARRHGLLSAEKLTQLIESELRRQDAARLPAMLDRVSSHMRQKYAALTDDEAEQMIRQWSAAADDNADDPGT
jgi:hypothetical protein